MKLQDVIELLYRGGRVGDIDGPIDYPMCEVDRGRIDVDFIVYTNDGMIRTYCDLLGVYLSDGRVTINFREKV